MGATGGRRIGKHGEPMQHAVPSTTFKVEAAASQALARTAGKASGFVLVALLVGNIFTPEAGIVRSGFGFGLIGLILFANCFLTSYSLRWLEIERWRLLTLVFVVIGTLSVAASALELYPKILLLPRRTDYIMRHGYFVFLLLPFIIGGYNIWSVGLPGLARFCKRFGIPILALLPIADIGTAHFMGTWQDGYTRFLDTAQIGICYYLVFSFYIIFTSKRALPLLLMTTALLLCRLLAYGSLFNSLASLLMFLILIVLSLPQAIGAARAWLIASLVPVALIAMTIEISLPSLCQEQEQNASAIFSHPGNTYWRCLAWRSNMADLFSTYLIGVGFGVPYHPFTTENWLASEMLENEMNISASAPTSEVLYVRGQHSSVINVFYRLGIAGGVIFLLMNWLLIMRLARAATDGSFLGRLSLIACGLMVLAFLQISSNVGLESPRYFLNYTLAISLALVCLEGVQAKRPRLIRGRSPHATRAVSATSPRSLKGSFPLPKSTPS
jgi:hypothetical protein